MIKYAKVINEETKACQVGVGTDTAYYEKLGMELLDVEKCEWNSGWYLKGYAPQEPESEKKAKRIEELKKQLDAIDLKQIRSLAAKAAGSATDEDLAILADLEEQKAIKRQELKDLED